MHTLSTFIDRLICTGIALAKDRRNKQCRQVVESDPSAIVLGHTVQESGSPSPYEIALTDTDRSRHVHIIGATGAGKSNVGLRLIDSDLRTGRSICVIDLRGDLLKRIYRRLATMEDIDPERLLVFDLAERDHVVGFNPLAGKGEPHTRAFHLLSIIREQAEGWGVQLEETLRNSLLLLAYHDLTLVELEQLLTNSDFRAALLSSVDDDQVRAFFGRYETMSSDRQLSLVQPVLNKVTPFLAIPTVRAMLGSRKPISLKRHLDKKGSILLISLAVDELHCAAYLMGSMFISAIQSAVLSRIDSAERSVNRVNLYIDEFENFAGRQFESIIAEGRRFGLSLTLSHQNLHQLPQGLKQCIRNNVHTSFFFQTGFTDASEVCRELSLDLTRDEACTALMNLAVGEAFLVRRGETTERVQTLLCADPKVSESAVADIRLNSLKHFGTPRATAKGNHGRRSACPTVEVRDDVRPNVRRGGA